MWLRRDNANIEQTLRRNRPEPRRDYLERAVAELGHGVRSNRSAWPDVVISLAPIALASAVILFVAITAGFPSLHPGSPFAAANVAYSAPTCSLATQGNHPRVTVSNINGNTTGTVTVTKAGGGGSESGTVTGSGSTTNPGSDKFDASHLTTPGTFSAHVVLQGSGVPGNFYAFDCGPTVLS